MKNPFIIIPFTKASACGNDFLIVHAEHATPEIHDLSRRLCDRHDGVGADGVEWLLPGGDADASIRLINADGSEAEISGNGTRCVAAYLADIRQATQIADRYRGRYQMLRADFTTGADVYFRDGDGKPESWKALSRCKHREGAITGTPVSMGNPHLVVFVDAFPDGWQSLAGEIQQQPCFPEGVNVEFAQVMSSEHDRGAFF